MNARRGLTLAALGIAASATVAACAAQASQYRTDAVAFIDSDPMFEAYNVDFENIDCTEPDSTDEGGTVACTADGDNGQSYAFTFTIVGENELQLTAIALVDAPSSEGSEPPDSTEPEATSGAEPAATSGAAGSAITAPAPAAITTATTAAATTAPPTTARAAAATTTTTPAG